jgi:hypothetical protein
LTIDDALLAAFEAADWPDAPLGRGRRTTGQRHADASRQRLDDAPARAGSGQFPDNSIERRALH